MSTKAVTPAVRPPRTRRHWTVRLGAIIKWWLSMLAGPTGKLSMFRVVMGSLVVTFVVHWPASWDWPTVAALAVIAFAIPFADLCSAIPVAEVLGAVQAMATGRTAAVIQKVRDMVDKSNTHPEEG